MFKLTYQLINAEERIVWTGITCTYLFYLTGTLYVVGALIGWALFVIMLLRVYVNGKLPSRASVPVIIWVWVAGMFCMLLALLVAHADYDMPVGQITKSTIGWAKGWALLALIPLIGAMVSVRPQVVVRACCVLASQSIVFLILGFSLAIIGFDGQLYVSPLKAVGGPISTFEVNLFGLNPETGKPRWPFFTPWAPAAGLLSCMFLIICLQDNKRFWRRAGVLGALIMCVFCQSRTGWIIFLLLVPGLMMFRLIRQPIWIIVMGVVFSCLFVFGEPVLEHVEQVHQDIKNSRPGSTRVRSALASLAVQRWESEAMLWGHGIVERGSKMVEHMPIGSHHSWYGLLFVKGIVGLLALAVPMSITTLYLLVCAFYSRLAVSALLIMFVFVGYSFYENLEILAYLYWPALLWLGIVSNPLKSTLFNHQSLGVAV